MSYLRRGFVLIFLLMGFAGYQIAGSGVGEDTFFNSTTHLSWNSSHLAAAKQNLSEYGYDINSLPNKRIQNLALEVANALGAITFELSLLSMEEGYKFNVDKEESELHHYFFMWLVVIVFYWKIVVLSLSVVGYLVYLLIKKLREYSLGEKGD